MKVPLHHLVEDWDLYPRNQPSWVTIARYANAMRQGKEFPPILVGRKDDKDVVIDGIHRFHAAKTAKLGFLKAELCRLPEKEWFAESIRRNAAHGQALSPQEVRRAIVKLQGTGYKDAEIADMVGVPASRFERFLDEKVVKVSGGNGVHVLKAITDAAAARGMSLDEIRNAEAKQQVRSIVLLLDQLIDLLEAGLVNRRDPKVIERVAKLRSLLG